MSVYNPWMGQPRSSGQTIHSITAVPKDIKPTMVFEMSNQILIIDCEKVIQKSDSEFILYPVKRIIMRFPDGDEPFEPEDCTIVVSKRKLKPFTFKSPIVHYLYFDWWYIKWALEEDQQTPLDICTYVYDVLDFSFYTEDDD